MDPKDHKRSKSQLAKSLLGRHGKLDARDAEESESPGPPSRSSPSASQSNISLTSTPASRSSVQLSHRARHRPQLATTTPPDNDAPSSTGTSVKGDAGPPSPTVTSLEQSVKLFKLYEALQNGNTAAIQKAIREEDEEAAQGRSSISSGGGGTAKTDRNAILRLAVQCAEPSVIEFVLSNIATSSDPSAGINSRDREGNTPLHLAAKLGRPSVVRMLLEQQGINDAIANYQGQTAPDVAKSPEIFQQLQLFRSLSVDADVRTIHAFVKKSDYDGLEKMMKDPRVRTTLSVNGGELATDPVTVETGGSLLHEAARKRDIKLIQMLLLNGADPFQRDRKGKLPQDVTKDDRTRAILKRSPAANEARQGIQERTILGSSSQQLVGTTASENALGNKEGREMKGYLKKWTNYTSGWKLRWFVLEDGVLSYYKNQGMFVDIPFKWLLLTCL
jgi:oxysterol-binding protein 1